MRHTTRRVLLAVATVTVVAAAGLAFAGPASALTTYTPSQTADCQLGLITCPQNQLFLRGAVELASTDGDDSVIQLQAGATYQLDACAGTPEEVNVTGDLDHRSAFTLTIVGDGTTIEQTCANERVFHQRGSGVITFEGVTLTGGDTSALSSGANGGGLASVGPVSLVDSQVVENLSGGSGGGIYAADRDVTAVDSAIVDNAADLNGGGISSGTVALDGVRVAGNEAGVGGTGTGGGIHLTSATTTASTVTDARITGNTAAGNGGGIYRAHVNGGNGDLTITGSTIDANTAGGTGGGIHTASITGDPVLIQNSTVHGNSAAAPGGGGGLSGLGGGVGPRRYSLVHATITGNSATQGANIGTGIMIEARATVVAEPLGGGTNCFLNFAGSASLGHNFADTSGAGCRFDDPDDVTDGGDPLLSTLANHGGPTATRIPSPASPLFDAIPAADCTLTDDQRNEVRPTGAGCEIGAVELNAFNDPIIAPRVIPAFAAVALTGVALLWWRRRRSVT